MRICKNWQDCLFCNEIEKIWVGFYILQRVISTHYANLNEYIYGIGAYGHFMMFCHLHCYVSS